MTDTVNSTAPGCKNSASRHQFPSTRIYEILRTRSRSAVINRINEFEMTNKTENTGSHTADQLLTIQGLASRAQVAAVTVRRWIMAGQAPAHIRVGRIIRFRLQDVEDWEDERAREQADKASARRAALQRVYHNVRGR